MLRVFFQRYQGFHSLLFFTRRHVPSERSDVKALRASWNGWQQCRQPIKTSICLAVNASCIRKSHILKRSLTVVSIISNVYRGDFCERGKSLNGKNDEIFAISSFCTWRWIKIADTRKKFRWRHYVCFCVCQYVYDICGSRRGKHTATIKVMNESVCAESRAIYDLRNIVQRQVEEIMLIPFYLPLTPSLLVHKFFSPQLLSLSFISSIAEWCQRKQ